MNKIYVLGRKNNFLRTIERNIDNNHVIYNKKSYKVYETIHPGTKKTIKVIYPWGR